MKETCYIGIGSNLGDRSGYLKNAQRALSRLPKTQIGRISALYETEPEGLPSQPWFLNEVVSLETALSPQDLLFHCLRIEAREGRIRTQRWGPRTLDVDILLFGERIIQQPDLQIPHPRLAERSFVLVPLSDVGPLVVHPIFKKTIITLLNEMDTKQKVHPYPLQPLRSHGSPGGIQ